MCVLKTLELLREAEIESGKRLKNALLLKRYYRRADLALLNGSEAQYLSAVNAKARIKWTTACLSEMYKHFDIEKDDEGPDFPIFLITIADKAHLTTAELQKVDFRAIRRKLGGALQGLSYIGMIEPGYYNVIYDRLGRKIKDVVSWHGHFLVWGTNREGLNQWRRKIVSRVELVIPHLRAVDIKQVPAEQFGHRLRYINKSPCTEYSIGKRKKPDENGSPIYKQNSRPLRPGHRVKLFHMLRDVTLPELAMAGGDGRALMLKIKYEALRDYRHKRGR